MMNEYLGKQLMCLLEGDNRMLELRKKVRKSGRAVLSSNSGWKDKECLVN